VAVVALPLTNLWLLGKREGHTPWRRPQAPVQQLQAAGVPCAVISNDDMAGIEQFLASHGLLHLLGWHYPDDRALEATLARQQELLQTAVRAAEQR